MAPVSELFAIAVEHQRAGRLQAAEQFYRQILAAAPNHFDAYNNLGVICRDQGMRAEAVACYRRALELKPDFAAALNNLGVACRDQGKLDEAVAWYRRALKVRPDYAEAHSNIGAALKDCGQLEEAVACCRRALELRPHFVELHSNLLYAELFCPGYDSRTLYEEHRQWNLRHAAPLAKSAPPYLNDRSGKNGDITHLCAAPSGPFRQMRDVPVFPPSKDTPRTGRAGRLIPQAPFPHSRGDWSCVKKSRGRRLRCSCRG